MDSDLEKIALFLDEHHVMSLATTDFKDLSTCSLFMYTQEIKTLLLLQVVMILYTYNT